MLCLPLDRPHIREYVKHPRALLADLIWKEATTVNPGARLKVEVTSRLPLSRETIPPKWMEKQNGTKRWLPLVRLCQTPPGGIHRRNQSGFSAAARVKDGACPVDSAPI
jgi:hypothetical protein